MSFGTRDVVPNAPIREAWERSGMGISEFARRMEYMRLLPDVGRVRRLLGLKEDNKGAGRKRGRYRESISYSEALRACEALGLDPVDLDL